MAENGAVELSRGASARPGGGYVGVRVLALAALGLGLALSTGCRRPAASSRDGDAAATAGPAPKPEGSAGVLVSDSALAALVAELLPEAERSSGLEAVRPPRFAVVGRDRLRGFLTESFRTDLPPERAEALTAVYARLGLVPDTLDLTATLLALYTEQVAGYYDPASDTLFVLRRVPRAQLKIVLLHELVHALQDQYVNLDSLVHSLRGDNDRSSAAQAAIEGQATLAMVLWQLRLTTGRDVDLSVLPDLGALLSNPNLAEGGELESLAALRAAPRFLQASLVFPYAGGLSLIQQLWEERPGRPPPFGRFLPHSTEQVLHPGRLLSSPPDEPARIRFPASPEGEWKEVLSDDLGEFETRVFLQEQLGDSTTASLAAEGWDGDRYRLLQGPPGEVLVWVTAWDTRTDAMEFAGSARRALLHRYGGADSTESGGPTEMDGAAVLEASGRRVWIRPLRSGARWVVLVVDGPARLPLGPDWPLARFEVDGG